jgi:hypothetical protein
MGLRKPTGGLLLLIGFVGMAIAPASASAVTFADPAGDNCREYTMIGTHCGPDISQVELEAPGDGNLHVTVSFSALPVDIIQQIPEFTELGVYPPTAASPLPNQTNLAYRFHRLPPTKWDLERYEAGKGITFLQTGSAVVGAMEIELIVPLAPLGDPASYKYAVNSGSTGEVIPEHPDLAPNEGLFELGAAPVTPVAAPATPAASKPRAKPRRRCRRGFRKVRVKGKARCKRIRKGKGKGKGPR